MPLLAAMLPPSQLDIADEGTGEALHRAHESDPDLFTSTNVEDETLGGSFHTTPPRSTQVPLVGPTSGGAEDLAILTALSSQVSELVQIKVKDLELKLKTRSRKVVINLMWMFSGADIPHSPPLQLVCAGVSSGLFLLVLMLGDPIKDKSPIMEVGDPPIKEGHFGRLRSRDTEMQRKRQQDVLDSAKYYTNADWTDIIGKVHANQGLTSDLLGPDVNEDNFAERMVALIAERRGAFAAQRFQEKRNKPLTYAQQKAYMRPLCLCFIEYSTSIYTTGWTMKHVKSLSDEQLKSEFEKIRNPLAADRKRGHTYGTRNKSLGTRKKSSTALDLDADDRSFIRVLSDDDDPAIFWEILLWLDRQDFVKALYRDGGQVSMKTFTCWCWYDAVGSWRLFPFSNVHVLETISGKFPLLDTEFMKVAPFGVHAVNFLMLLQRLSPAIIRFPIHEGRIVRNIVIDSLLLVRLLYFLLVRVKFLLVRLEDLSRAGPIIRADGSSRRYSAFIQMLRSFDREDLETLWKLVKAKHGYTRPEEGYERVLWGDLKTMFEHHVEDAVWRNLQESKVLVWKLFDSCGVHFVRFQNLHVFMLVEKRYPLTPATITDMLNKKLQADHLNEMIVGIKRLLDDLRVTAVKLLCDHGRWEIPLDKGLFEEILVDDAEDQINVIMSILVFVPEESIFPQLEHELTLDFEIDMASDFDNAKYCSMVRVSTSTPAIVPTDIEFRERREIMK
ncbi:hypothetical protein Tco_0442544 [Tanacetum coccineum]